MSQEFANFQVQYRDAITSYQYLQSQRGAEVYVDTSIAHDLVQDGQGIAIVAVGRTRSEHTDEFLILSPGSATYELFERKGVVFQPQAPDELLVVHNKRGGVRQLRPGLAIEIGRTAAFGSALSTDTSRRHARLTNIIGGGLMITDLGSANGTLISRGSRPYPEHGYWRKTEGTEDSTQSENVIPPTADMPHEADTAVFDLPGVLGERLIEISKSYAKELDKHEISPNDIAIILISIRSMRQKNIAEPKIRRRLLADFHPDSAPEGIERIRRVHLVKIVNGLF